ncbi:MAG: amidohydrolase family protein, partial [Acutalibacteraceae bacterium]|nr:amidohydrolase family protein [Acutalibacteraceae bacterium]
TACLLSIKALRIFFLVITETAIRRGTQRKMISESHTLMDMRYAKEIIDIHGADKILFGSDAPWNVPLQDIELVKCFGLTEDEEKAVLGENARKLLGL